MQSACEVEPLSAEIFRYDGSVPVISVTAFLAPTAVIIGDVEIGEGASVWFGAVLRGDICPIRIGSGTNIQDGVVIHGDEGGLVTIADDVTVGHGAIVHGCAVGANALIGMGAIVLDNASVGEGALIGAGAVVAPGTQVDPQSLWLGCPARKVRDLSSAAAAEMRSGALHYRDQAQRYRSGHFHRAVPIHRSAIKEKQ
jgi:carbonic anhydrase/acetyltransferase-like protein (isoleucine patch superfamily)